MLAPAPAQNDFKVPDPVADPTAKAPSSRLCLQCPATALSPPYATSHLAFLREWCNLGVGECGPGLDSRPSPQLGVGELCSAQQNCPRCPGLSRSELLPEKSDLSFHKKARTQPLPTEMWLLQPRQGPSLVWRECGAGKLKPGRPAAASPEQVREWAVCT